MASSADDGARLLAQHLGGYVRTHPGARPGCTRSGPARPTPPAERFARPQATATLLRALVDVIDG